MNFDINEYEPVQERIKRYYADNTDGRIVTKLEKDDGKICVFSAYLYRNKEEQKENLFKASGWAHEIAGVGYVNKTSHYENCETSAIGRALANAGYSGDKRASREEIQGAVAREENANTPNGVEPNHTPRSRAPQVSERRQAINARINKLIEAGKFTAQFVNEMKVKEFGREKVTDDELEQLAKMLITEYGG